MVTLILGLWLLVIVWPGSPPILLVAALYLAIGMGGPGSLVGFDVARTFNPSHALGSASGFVNTGGFLGGFISVFGIGLVIDAVRSAGGGAAELYTLDSFRLAFLVPVGGDRGGSGRIARRTPPDQAPNVRGRGNTDRPALGCTLQTTAGITPPAAED